MQRRRIKYAARFTNLDLLANVVDASPGRRRHLPAALALAALAALVVAMARPQAVVAVPRDDATVVLTMDSSASMTATDVAPDAPRRGEVGGVVVPRRASRPLPHRPRVVLELGQVLEEPTDDRDAVRSSLESIQGDVGTALGDAIVTSVDARAGPEEQENSPAASRSSPCSCSPTGRTRRAASR